jgi:HK97 family phage prohead protease
MTILDLGAKIGGELEALLPHDLSASGAKQKRETRLFHPGKIEMRASEKGDALTMSGYASVTGENNGYTIQDWLGEYKEVIVPGAFKRTLNNNDDVKLLLNHDGLALARTKSGTLNLREITDPDDDPLQAGWTGLWCEASLEPRSGMVNDVRLAMERGDLDEMSFAFQAVDQEWSPDFTQRNITEAKLFDVSVVTYPANPATSATIRGIEAVDSLSDDAAKELMGRLQKRFTDEPHGMSLAQMQALHMDLR